MPFETAGQILGDIAEAATVAGINRIYAMGLKTDGSNAASLKVSWNDGNGLQRNVDLNVPATGASPVVFGTPLSANPTAVIIDPTGTGAVAWLEVDHFGVITGGASATSNLICQISATNIPSSTNLVCQFTKA